jgi:ribonucleoside-triphosphate reductase (formate)
MFSARADATTLRSYCRPLHDDYLETWPQVVERSTYQHHLKLWEDAGGTPDLSELAELRELGLQRKSMVAGRTLWLGGTEYAYSRAASQFNCAATRYFTVYDAVDAAWLLLNGCGVGAKPQVGVLHGYTRPIPELEVVPSERSKDYRGREDNLESLDGGVWTIAVGDSAQAWAKALGKMLNPKVRHADKLCLDFSEVRGPGGRLKGYGWICNGYKPLADALCVVHSILNEKAGELLDELDIGDLHNLMGQILSSRRAAEILHMDSWNPRLQEFMRCKERYWEVGKDYRRQSNNSVLYWSEPSRSELASLLELAFANGDPAPINAAASVKIGRAS